MKRVSICAPLGGDVAQNIQRAKRYMEFALRSGVAPMVPHFYALCLNDDVTAERELGMAAGRAMLFCCDELWVFGETVTPGMRLEIQFCKSLNIPVRYIQESEIVKKIGGVIHEQSV
ncbi:MAG: hypothetical protein IJ649_07195 [Oscillospiraceae bacterium]|nr:hypothetical protein [Oscillospiraceae bacterium]